MQGCRFPVRFAPANIVGSHFPASKMHRDHHFLFTLLLYERLQISWTAHVFGVVCAVVRMRGHESRSFSLV